jgi:hypothetical protein
MQEHLMTKKPEAELVPLPARNSHEVEKHLTDTTNATAKFKTEFNEWITKQNAFVESKGIPGSDLRPW